MRARLMTVLVLLALAGCGGLPRNVVVLLPDEDGTTGKVVVSNGGTSVALDAAYAAAETDPGKAPDRLKPTTPAEVDKEFAATLAATPAAPAVFHIFFGNAVATLDEAARAAAANAIAAAKARPHVDVTVVGNTDATGASADANMALSEQRALAVRDALVAGGVPPGVIVLSYFGPNNPMVPNRPGLPEPLNRRVDVTVR